MESLDDVIADGEVRAALCRGLDVPATPTAAALAATLAAAFGRPALAVIHYGSRAHLSDARPDSAHDFFVIVESYREAYQSLADSFDSAISPATAISLAQVLPPNVHSFLTPPGDHRSKCAVLSLRDLKLAARMKTKDHFTQGRLFQQVQLVWVRDEPSREAVCSALVEMRIRTFQWGRCFLPASFDAETYCRVLLETSFSAEVRPEGDDRVGQLLEAQRDALLPLYDTLLGILTRKRILAQADNVYRQVLSPTRRERRRYRRYFRWSKARATVRWAKHVTLYEDWLDYIVQKISRRSGIAIELTARERRWPLIFLWPKAFVFLRTRPQQRRVLK